MTEFVLQSLWEGHISKAYLPRNLYHLRRMVPGDIPAVLEIERLSFSNPWPPATFLGEVDNTPFSNPWVIVHESFQKIIGYVIYWRLKMEVQISNISIHPEFRRLGVAEAVMHTLIKQVTEEKAEYIFLEVRPSNLPARSLYRKLGFRVFGVRENYYTNPDEDALVMGMFL